jgi:phage tail sheath protein FI
MPITEGGKFSPVDRIVSPGVFTRENDLSGLAQGVADIGGAIVAPFPRGPGFAPTLVRSVAELEEKFGVADGVYYGPYTAKDYLTEQGQVTICRVGALTGYKQSNPLMIYAIPGTWARLGISASVETGSTGNAAPSYAESTGGSTTITDYISTDSSSFAVGSVSASVSMSAVLTLTFENNTGSFLPAGSGSLEYAGVTVTAGEVNINASAASVYITSSFQGNSSKTAAEKLNQALLESTETVSYFSMSFSSQLFLTASSTFNVVDGSALRLNNAVFKAFRSSGGCGTVLYLTAGQLSGSFGPYIGTFVSSSTVSSDPCASTSSAELPQILAILGNTRNATQNTTNLSLSGFSGSVMNTVTASSGPAGVAERATSLDFSIALSSSAGSGFGTYEMSLDPNSSKYITSVFGSDPTAGNPSTQVSGQKIEAAYIYKMFEDSIARVAANKDNWKIAMGTSVEGQVRVGEVMNFTDAASLTPSTADSEFSLRQAETPWITSQTVSPWRGASGTSVSTKYDLFKVHTLGDGTAENTRFKVEISNVKLAGTVPGSDYGSFTLALRDYSDTDKRPKILEIFQNLSMDPNSANFVARRIGDRYNYITFAGKIVEFGTYSTLSKYIRIEMTTDTYPVAAVPYGFRAFATPINSNYSSFLPPMRYTKASTYSEAPGRYASGVMMGSVPVGADDELSALYPTASAGVGCDRDNRQYFSPLPDFGSSDSNGENEDFDLEADYSSNGVTAGNGVPSYYVAADEVTNVKKRKFVLGMQGGFDGQWPAIPINVGSDIIAGNTQGLNCTNINSAGSVGYKQCVAALGNADEFDINLIVTPGIFSSLHSYVTNLVVDMCEARGDCFYIMDNVVFPASNQSTGLIDAAVAQAEMFDSNYVATYYPWVKILDTNTNRIIGVPPSVVIPSVFASNDAVAAEWFAPAGLNRGGIQQAVQVYDRLTHQERDTLYEGRVNPIAAFPGQGISVWGQKTLQVKPSALDRISVRRLLIALKKFIASSSKFLTFEQNVASTRNKFLSIVNPYLESVQQRSGLYAFQVVMDEKNNTPDLIDRNVLYGQIYLQPSKTAEFIILDFNILPSGASFPSA